MRAARDAAAPEGGHLRGGAEIKAGGPETSVPPSAVAMWLDAWDAGRAVGDAEGHQRGHVEGYALGHTDGRAEALAEVEAAEAARDDALVRSIASAAAQGAPFAELAARRGDHARAEAQRRTLRDRGVA
ncbi:hypothetical protein AFE02nite_04380 [Actinotalea fermentans]|uniref:Uncharacterized protein n=1 Tax=Actinotalea fermentans TaxID=43671 RepID=A0A511YU31_9CELL|nr:hypothetical protein AFE02nite_04380 [Actinotalea fermentans]